MVGIMSPLIVGIAGGTGSGKTTVAEKLILALPPDHAALIQHDWYYRDRSQLPPASRALINFDEPASLDNERLIADLHALKAGRAVECPQYDFASHTRHAASRRVDPRAIVIVEGMLIFAVPELRDVFEDRGRDIASIDIQYRESVRPMHLLHVAPSRRHAHLIIPEGGENTPALEVIVGRLLYLLGVPPEFAIGANPD